MPVMQSSEIHYPFLIGANATKPASLPTVIWPLPGMPIEAAGYVDIHRTTSDRLWPRFRASVQTTDSPSCSDEVPPQAAAKSPLSGRLSSGGLGEWSETTKSITPSARACQSRSRFAASRTGGQLLNWVAPSATSSADKAR